MDDVLNYILSHIQLHSPTLIRFLSPFSHSTGKSSDEIILDMCADMMKNVPVQVQDEDEAASPGQAAPLSYEDMLNVSKGIDLKRVKKKLKVADPVKKKDGGGRSMDMYCQMFFGC